MVGVRVLAALLMVLALSGCGAHEQEARPTIGLAPAQYDPRPFVMVMGAVNQPGRYQMIAPVTVSQLVAAAGGITALGYRNGTTLTRTTFEGKRIRVRIALENVLEGSQPDVPLYPGDMVFVPERCY